MQEQERDLLRAFRARLFDVQTELEKEKQKKNDGASTWIERTRQTEAELDWAKEMADRLDRVNQGLSKENARLKGHFHSQEEDRAFLIKQLVSVKKENTLLRQDMQAMDEQMRALQDAAKSKEAELTTVQSQVTRRKFSAMPMSGSTAAALAAAAAAGGAAAPYTLLQHSDPAGVQSAPLLMTTALSSADADARYKDVLSRMKRLLETERRALRLARAAYASELQQRSDLETLLRAAVDDVRAELAVTRQRLSSPAQYSGKESRGASRGGGSRGGVRAPAATATSANTNAASGGVGALLPEVAISELGREERDRVLELLLSQERVITLLYSKTFPVQGQAADASAPAGAVAAAASANSHSALKAAFVKSGSMTSLPLPARPESAT
jgi:hypothetical protein